jgi:poly-gamma-glutamate synthesis protein (capsule biosynthesis protein)
MILSRKTTLPIFFVIIGAVLFGAVFRGLPSRTDLTVSAVAERLPSDANVRKSVVQLPSPPKVTILFGGDMMFDRWIRTMMRTKGASYPLTPLRETFLGADAVIANLEGPITGNASVSETSEIGSRDNYVFTFDPNVATMLKDFNIIANIGNNHILNFKEAGVVETEKNLRDAGVGYFGSPLPEDRILVRDIRGFRIAFVNYNQFISRGEAKALEDIRTARGRADLVVLYAHWGKEYVPATDREKTLAHEFIDAGADLVIGSHPHVVQEHETYRGKTIYYSLGNLVFDQYEKEEMRNGLLLSVAIDPKTRGYEISEKPVIMGPDGQTRLVLQ